MQAEISAPPVPTGKIKSYGAFGLKYEVGQELRQLDDGDWMVEVKMLVVWKLDRLGRSVKNLVNLVSDLHKQSVQFKCLTDTINTGRSSGRFFFHVMASLVVKVAASGR